MIPIYCCRSIEVWVRAVWVWGRSEISWPLAQTSWPGSLRPSSWDSLFLDRGISISIRLCGQTFGRSQRNSHLNQLKHKKMLSSMKVIYLTLTSCSFPILYYTSIESNMERMWWTVERIFREKLKLDFWRFCPKKMSHVIAPLRHHPRPCIQFLGPRGPLRTPSFARPPVRPPAPKIKITSKALWITPGSCQTPHMKYYRKEDDVFYQTKMTNTKTKTNTKTNTKTKTEKF